MTSPGEEIAKSLKSLEAMVSQVENRRAEELQVLLTGEKAAQVVKGLLGSEEMSAFVVKMIGLDDLKNAVRDNAARVSLLSSESRGSREALAADLAASTGQLEARLSRLEEDFRRVLGLVVLSAKHYWGVPRLAPRELSQMSKLAEARDPLPRTREPAAPDQEKPPTARADGQATAVSPRPTGEAPAEPAGQIFRPEALASQLVEFAPVRDLFRDTGNASKTLGECLSSAKSAEEARQILLRKSTFKRLRELRTAQADKPSWDSAFNAFFTDPNRFK